MTNRATGSRTRTALKVLGIAAAAAIVAYAGAVSALAVHYRLAAINLTDTLQTTVVAPETLHHLVLRTAGVPLDTTDPEAINAALREHVYKTNNIGTSGTQLTEASAIFALLGEAGFDHLCGGMSAALAWALNAVGIEARTVQLATQDFLDGTDRFDTHVTVEAKIGETWRISDPTFNLAIACSSGETNLSVTEARACLAKGSEIAFDRGELQLPERTVESNSVAYRDFFDAYKTAEAEEPAGWLDEALAKY